MRSELALEELRLERPPKVMRRAGVLPSEFTYTAAITACSKGQQWRGALRLLRLCRRRPRR